MKPQRIQLRRTKGWRIPKNTVVVSRPSKWGNQFSKGTQVENATLYLEWLDGNSASAISTLKAARAELRGKNIACWCKIGTPCHGQVLLAFANS